MAIKYNAIRSQVNFENDCHTVEKAGFGFGCAEIMPGADGLTNGNIRKCGHSPSNPKITSHKSWKCFSFKQTILKKSNHFVILKI